MSLKNYKTFRKQLQEQTFKDDDVLYVVHALGIDTKKIDVVQLRKGMNAELEHRDITNGDPILTAKIALVHIKEFPTYYDELEKMEKKLAAKKK